jgi:hypothetical protein
VRVRTLRDGLVVVLVLASSGFCAGSAPAAPASGPHETLDHRLTTKRPNAPSGFSFEGRYHAAGDPDSYPPYMERMVFYPHRGLRYDTSVPAQCSASDVELVLRGPAACPEGSRLGGGETETAFMGRYPSTVAVDFFNDANGQIILARSPILTTVARGKIHPDGSVEFASPTCYPSLNPVGCPVDNVLQLRSSISVPPYTTSEGSWLTTPPRCPKSRRWTSTVRLWWKDGSVDTVVIKHPCVRPRSQRRRGR